MMESTTVDYTAYDATSALTPSKECRTEYTPYQSPASELLSTTSSFTESPASSRGGASSPERYTPTKPGIRIRKRAPSSSIYSTKGTKYEKLEKIIAKGSHRDLKSTAELLLLTPGKSILRREQAALGASRRSVNFSDEIGLPLVEVQEIPSVRNGQPTSDCENDVFEENQTNGAQINDSNEAPFRLIKCYRPDAKFCAEVSKSEIVERKRIRDLGILTGPVFGVIELQDDPALAEEADNSVKTHKPTIIPMSSASVSRGSLIRDLPLPGRKQSPPSQIAQEPLQQYTPSPVYETKGQTTSQATIEYAQLTEPPVTEYYATTSFETPVKTEDTSVKNIVSSLSLDTKKLLSLLTANRTPVAAPQSPAIRIEQEYVAQVDQPSTSDEPTGYHYVGSFDTKTPTLPQQNHYSPLPQASQAAHSLSSTHSVLSAIQHQQELLAKPLPGIIGNQYVQGAWKINKPCTYFVYKNDGCQRGESCRYLHDQALKDELLRNKVNQRQMSPPLAHQMRSDSMGQRVERIGSRGQRVSRFDPVGPPPPRDRRVFDQGNNDRRVYDQGNNDRRRNERSRFNRRSRFDRSPNSRSPQN